MSSSPYATRDWRDHLRSQILERDRYRCTNRVCRRGPDQLRRGLADLHVDHIVALADGGTNEPGNLRTLCTHCHGQKTAADKRARARRQPRRGMRAARHPWSP